MARLSRTALIAALVLLVLPVWAGAVVEEKSGKEYPDEITIGEGPAALKMKATGVGLREKTFMKVDVYTIVSYMSGELDFEGDKGLGLVNADAPKRLRMDLRRGFSREKLINSFKDVIEKNFDDMAPFAAEMETFFGYFTRDAEENDVLIFTYLPGVGLTTNLNGEDKGVIANFEFTRALWTVWFGRKPASGGLKKSLLSELEE